MLVFLNFYILKLLTMLTNNSTCLYSEFFKTITDIFLLRNGGDLSFITKSANLEQNANVNIILTDSNFWSIIPIENSLLCLLLLVLVAPLLFCVVLVLFFFKNQLKIYLFAKRGKLDAINPNFTVYTKEDWRTLWGYAYDFTP